LSLDSSKSILNGKHPKITKWLKHVAGSLIVTQCTQRAYKRQINKELYALVSSQHEIIIHKMF